MFFNRILVLICMLSGAYSHAEDLDFSLKSAWPKVGEHITGSKLIPWDEYILRPSSRIFLNGAKLDEKETYEIFEARSAGTVSKPVSFFTKTYLDNIQTLQSFDPADQFVVTSEVPALTVTTTVPFPSLWKKLIAKGKEEHQFPSYYDDFLQMQSYFEYVSGSAISKSPVLIDFVKTLDIVGRTPEVISAQTITKVNEIAQYGKVITFYYNARPGETLIVNYFVLLLKHKDLDRGKRALGVTIDGRGTLMAEFGHGINTLSGIGRGLPGYVEELFTTMMAAIEAAKPSE